MTKKYASNCSKIQRDMLHSISKKKIPTLSSRNVMKACMNGFDNDGEIHRQLSDTDSYCKLKGDLPVCIKPKCIIFSAELMRQPI